MPGLLQDDAFDRVYNAWHQSLRRHDVLSRLALPDLRPIARGFNLYLTGDDTGDLNDACKELIGQDLDAITIIHLVTYLAETFTDEVGVQSGAVNRSLLSSLGDVCGLLSSGLVAGLEEQSRRDPLTALENRRAYDQELADRIAKEEPTTLVMLDIDHFKAINDTKGHPEGDRQLKRLGSELRIVLPDGARAYRIGGDEFAALFPEASSDRARAAMTSLGEVEDVPAFSWGSASFPNDASDTVALYRAADVAMYDVKAVQHRAGH